MKPSRLKAWSYSGGAELEKLEKNKIDIEEVSIISKAGEAVFSSVKLQLQYSAMLGHSPKIDFLHDCHDGKATTAIEQVKPKAIK